VQQQLILHVAQLQAIAVKARRVGTGADRRWADLKQLDLPGAFSPMQQSAQALERSAGTSLTISARTVMIAPAGAGAACSSSVSVDPAPRKPAHVQGSLEMELAGLEPASWVRSRNAVS
jgi:hypothetical protein